jgi:hypothetical protein
MDERTATLENAYYRNVLNVIEGLLWGIPRPAYIEEKLGRKSITECGQHFLQYIPFSGISP